MLRSWPLPKEATTSPARAMSTPKRIASARSGTIAKHGWRDSACVREGRSLLSPSLLVCRLIPRAELPTTSCTPAAISRFMSSNFSVRGSSAVMIVKSASRPLTWPINRRLPRSRRPAQPKIAISLPPPLPQSSATSGRRVSNARSRLAGECAKSTTARKSCPQSIRCIRPKTAVSEATPLRICSGGMPSPRVTAAAHRMFDRLNSPINRVFIGMKPPRQTRSKRVASGKYSMLRAYTSAFESATL